MKSGDIFTLDAQSIEEVSKFTKTPLVDVQKKCATGDVYSVAKSDTGAGDVVRGFVFDVSGSGTAVISGARKNEALFRRVMELADDAGERVKVHDPKNVPFEQTHSGAEATDTGNESRLRELRRLYDAGLITQDQFDRKQQEVLDDL